MAQASGPLSLADIARADPATIHDWMIAQQSQTKAVTEAFAAVLENGSEPRTIAKITRGPQRRYGTRLASPGGGHDWYAHDRPFIGGELNKTVQGETASPRPFFRCTLPARSTTSSAAFMEAGDGITPGDMVGDKGSKVLARAGARMLLRLLQ
jgi:hypothetical protein